MLRHKNIDRICCVVLAVTILLTCGFMGAAATGLVEADNAIGYENRLFDQSRVHTIDIVMDDWDAFLETCTSEVYSSCTVIIDGESFGNAAIRGKGNTSLSSVAQFGNDRYSFKIEFDQYQSGRTYHGLDKLSLNNIIQDKTYLKDYVAYTLMNKMGVAAPLCSFAQIRVNGEDWGFYLAVEGVEDSFLQRNYGSNHGELYKPDSMSFGGGRGNGVDFDMDAFAEQFSQDTEVDEDGQQTASDGESDASTAATQMPGGFDPAAMTGEIPEGFDPSAMTGEMPEGFDPSTVTGEIPEGFDPSNMEMPGNFGGRGGFSMDGMGSSDVKLQYVDDDPSSYSNIFNNAKTDITEADQQRLIESLKTLSEGEDIESVVDVEAVIRYFVVHNFLCNDDSYTGQMIHNYYLYEEDGVMSMIPWDYNLAFGGFSMGGMGGSGATSTVNSPIDSLVSTGDISSRPMAAWIFSNETYTDLYHEIYAEFMADVFESGWFETEITRVIEMIDPYVQSDENGFFSYEEFAAGAAALKEFCSLRAQSVAGQLDGTIASTSDAQRSADANLVDASHIDLSDMGEFGMGGGGMGGDRPDDMSGMQGNMGGGNFMGMPSDAADATGEANVTGSFDPAAMGGQTPDGSAPTGMQGQAADGFDPSAMDGQTPGGSVSTGMQGQAADGFDPSAMGGQVPGGSVPTGMQGQAADGFDPSAMDGQTPGAPDSTNADAGGETARLTGEAAATADSEPTQEASMMTGSETIPGEATANEASEPVNGEASVAGAEPAADEAAQPDSEASSSAAEGESAQQFGGRDRRASGDIPQVPGEMGFGSTNAGTQVSSETQWAMLIGSVILLIAAILFSKFFKSNL